MPPAATPGPQEPPPRRKILIVRTSALGDVVQTLPALAALRQLFPRAEIHWLVEPLGAEILAGHPQIDRLHLFDRQQWKRWLRSPRAWPSLLAQVLKLTRALRRERFDLVIDFQGNTRSALLLLAAGGRIRLGFHARDVAELGANWFTNRQASPVAPRLQRAEKNLELPRALGYRGGFPAAIVPLADDARAWARAFFAAIPGSGPTIVVHPGVSRFGEIKRWPAEHFRKLVELLQERLAARVVVTWGPGEQALAAQVWRAGMVPELLPLGRLIALVREAELVIAADTGVLHLGAMIGTPTVGIYGPKDARVHGPRSRHGEVVVSTAPCSPCRLRVCEHRICMALIPPEEVSASVARVLEAARAGVAAP